MEASPVPPTPSAGPETIYTVGHSTRSWEELRAIVATSPALRIVDVRKVPRSRHNPQFDQETFAASVRAVGWDYEHAPRLGGLRRPTPESPNVGWRTASFRGYADYMRTREFLSGLHELIDSSRRLPTAILCAEASPLRCHRRLIADALLVRGWTVVHLIDVGRQTVHELTPGARVVDGLPVYLGAPDHVRPIEEFANAHDPGSSVR